MTGTVTVTALAGCSVIRSLTDRGYGGPELFIYNGASERRRIEFEVTHSGETVLQDTLDLEPDESASYDNPFTSAGTYTITASTDSGLEESYTWEERSESSDGDGDGLDVRIETDTITFEEVTY